MTVIDTDGFDVYDTSNPEDMEKLSATLKVSESTTVGGWKSSYLHANQSMAEMVPKFNALVDALKTATVAINFLSTKIKYLEEGKASMALKKLGDLKEKPAGVDYSAHLGKVPHKPIVGATTVSKKTPEGEALVKESSEALHQGVASSGVSISVEGGRTINLGNYESARIGVTITVPCDMDTLDEAYALAAKWIDEKIQAEVASIGKK